jgi:F-type H+-transporting ATPase subunit epsilon
MLKFEITTPERVVLTREADSVSVPTSSGEITVLPGHIPLVSVLATGMITVRRGQAEEYLAVSGGFLEVGADGRVRALADSADRADELDMEKVEAARRAAEEALSEKRRAADVSSAAAVASLERELARLRVARHYRLRRQPLHGEPPALGAADVSHDR